MLFGAEMNLQKQTRMVSGLFLTEMDSSNSSASTSKCSESGALPSPTLGCESCDVIIPEMSCVDDTKQSKSVESVGSLERDGNPSKNDSKGLTSGGASQPGLGSSTVCMVTHAESNPVAEEKEEMHSDSIDLANSAVAETAQSSLVSIHSPSSGIQAITITETPIPQIESDSITNISRSADSHDIKPAQPETDLPKTSSESGPKQDASRAKTRHDHAGGVFQEDISEDRGSNTQLPQTKNCSTVNSPEDQVTCGTSTCSSMRSQVDKTSPQSLPKDSVELEIESDKKLAGSQSDTKCDFKISRTYISEFEKYVLETQTIIPTKDKKGKLGNEAMPSYPLSVGSDNCVTIASYIENRVLKEGNSTGDKGMKVINPINPSVSEMGAGVASPVLQERVITDVATGGDVCRSNQFAQALGLVHVSDLPDPVGFGSNSSGRVQTISSIEKPTENKSCEPYDLKEKRIITTETYFPPLNPIASAVDSKDNDVHHSRLRGRGRGYNREVRGGRGPRARGQRPNRNLISTILKSKGLDSTTTDEDVHRPRRRGRGSRGGPGRVSDRGRGRRGRRGHGGSRVNALDNQGESNREGSIYHSPHRGRRPQKRRPRGRGRRDSQTVVHLNEVQGHTPESVPCKEVEEIGQERDGDILSNIVPEPVKEANCQLNVTSYTDVPKLDNCQSDVHRKKWLSDSSTIKSLINQPTLLQVSSHKYSRAKTISSILSERKRLGNNKGIELDYLPHLREMSGLCNSMAYQADSAVSQSESTVACVSTSLLHGRSTTLPMTTVQPPYSTPTIANVLSADTRTTFTPQQKSQLQVPPDLSNVLSTHNASSIPTASSANVIPRLVALLNSRMGTENRDSKSVSSTKVKESTHIIDLTEESNSVASFEGISVAAVPLCGSPRELPSSSSLPTSEISVSAHQLSQEGNSSKVAPKGKGNLSMFHTPISLPRNMYCAGPGISKPRPQSSPAVHAPTVLSLLRKRPVHPALPVSSPSQGERNSTAGSSKTNENTPLQTPAHTQPCRETLRLTHIMTPPPAHSKPCSSDIYIEPAPPDLLPIDHINVLPQRNGTHKENSSTRETTNNTGSISEEPICMTSTGSKSREERTSRPSVVVHSGPIHAGGPSRSHVESSDKVSDKVQDDTTFRKQADSPLSLKQVGHSTSTMPSDVQNQHSNKETYNEENAPIPIINSQPKKSAQQLPRYIPNVPVVNKPINHYPKERCLSCCGHDAFNLNTHGLMFPHCSHASTCPKVTLQQKCCQHLTGVPPPAHSKIPIEVQQAAPLDLTAAPPQEVDVGLDLTAKNTMNGTLHTDSHSCTQKSTENDSKSTNEKYSSDSGAEFTFQAVDYSKKAAREDLGTSQIEPEPISVKYEKLIHADKSETSSSKQGSFEIGTQKSPTETASKESDSNINLNLKDSNPRIDEVKHQEVNNICQGETTTSNTMKPINLGVGQPPVSPSTVDFSLGKQDILGNHELPNGNQESVRISGSQSKPVNRNKKQTPKKGRKKKAKIADGRSDSVSQSGACASEKQERAKDQIKVTKKSKSVPEVQAVGNDGMSLNLLTLANDKKDGEKKTSETLPLGKSKLRGKKSRKRRFTVRKIRKNNLVRDPAKPKRKYKKRQIPIHLDVSTAFGETLQSGRPKRATVSLGAYKKACSCSACINYDMPKRRRSKESSSSYSRSPTPSTTAIHNTESMTQQDDGDTTLPEVKADVHSAIVSDIPLEANLKLSSSESLICQETREAGVGQNENSEDPTKLESPPKNDLVNVQEKPCQVEPFINTSQKDNDNDKISKKKGDDENGLNTKYDDSKDPDIEGSPEKIGLTKEESDKEECKASHRNKSPERKSNPDLSSGKSPPEEVENDARQHHEEVNIEVGRSVITSTLNNKHRVHIKEEIKIKPGDNVSQNEEDGNHIVSCSDQQSSQPESNVCIRIIGSLTDPNTDHNIATHKPPADEGYCTSIDETRHPKEASQENTVYSETVKSKQPEPEMTESNSNSDSDSDLPSFSSYLAQVPLDATEDTTMQDSKKHDSQVHSTTSDDSGLKKSGGNLKRRKRKGRTSLSSKRKSAKKTKTDTTIKPGDDFNILDDVDELPDIEITSVADEKNSADATEATEGTDVTIKGEFPITSCTKKVPYHTSLYQKLIKPCSVVLQRIQLCSSNKTNSRIKGYSRKRKSPSKLEQTGSKVQKVAQPPKETPDDISTIGRQNRLQISVKCVDNESDDDASATSAYSDGGHTMLESEDDMFQLQKTEPVSNLGDANSIKSEGELFQLQETTDAARDVGDPVIVKSENGVCQCQENTDTANESGDPASVKSENECQLQETTDTASELGNPVCVKSESELLQLQEATDQASHMEDAVIIKSENELPQLQETTDTASEMGNPASLKSENELQLQKTTDTASEMGNPGSLKSENELQLQETTDTASEMANPGSLKSDNELLQLQETIGTASEMGNPGSLKSDNELLQLQETTDTSTNDLEDPVSVQSEHQHFQLQKTTASASNLGDPTSLKSDHVKSENELLQLQQTTNTPSDVGGPVRENSSSKVESENELLPLQETYVSATHLPVSANIKGESPNCTPVHNQFINPQRIAEVRDTVNAHLKRPCSTSTLSTVEADATGGRIPSQKTQLECNENHKPKSRPIADDRKIPKQEGNTQLKPPLEISSQVHIKEIVSGGAKTNIVSNSQTSKASVNETALKLERDSGTCTPTCSTLCGFSLAEVHKGCSDNGIADGKQMLDNLEGENDMKEETASEPSNLQRVTDEIRNSHAKTDIIVTSSRTQIMTVDKRKEAGKQNGKYIGNEVPKDNQLLIRKTLYVGLKKLDEKLIYSLNKGPVQYKSVKGVNSGQCIPEPCSGLSTVRVNKVPNIVPVMLDKSSDSESTKPRHTASDQESILEVLQREVMANTMVKPFEFENSSSKVSTSESVDVDDSVMPPLSPTLSRDRRNLDKQSPLWGYLAEVDRT